MFSMDDPVCEARGKDRQGVFRENTFEELDRAYRDVKENFVPY